MSHATKQILPANIRNPKTHILVNVLDLATVLHNLLEGSRNENVGWESATTSLREVTNRLNPKILVHEGMIEEALWSCNLMREQEKFWDVKGRTFDQFIKSILKDSKFNKDYNYIVKPGDI